MMAKFRIRCGGYWDKSSGGGCREEVSQRVRVEGIAELTLGFAALTSRLGELDEKHRAQPTVPRITGNRVVDRCQLEEISFDHDEEQVDVASRLAVGLVTLDGRTAARSKRKAPRSVAIVKCGGGDAISPFKSASFVVSCFSAVQRAVRECASILATAFEAV